jgi:NAD+ kinase
MKKKIKTVGLIGKYKDATVGEPIARLEKFLRARRLEILIDDNTAKCLKTSAAPSRPLSEIGKEIDLAIVIGGDGTMLYAARQLAAHGVLFIGVNLGRLGFLTDIRAESMTDEIGKILDGDYQAEDRLLLHAEVMRKGKIAHEARAFNDVIISKGELARLIEFEAYLDGEFVSSVRGDGIIISSPTGSTAYALSAGGPILHPTLPALVLVPICPHTFSNRPIVVGADSVVEVVISDVAPQRAQVTLDGQLNFALHRGDHIYVRRYESPIQLIHPSGHSHYDVLRAKLHWGKHL